MSIGTLTRLKSAGDASLDPELTVEGLSRVKAGEMEVGSGKAAFDKLRRDKVGKKEMQY